MKSLKVFYNGKPLRDIYPHATKFQVFKFKLARFTKKLAIITLAVGVYVGVFYALVRTPSVTHVSAQEVVTEVKKDTLTQKVDELKEEVLDTLQACESKGIKESDGLVTYDNNKAGTIKGINVFSFGPLQWKVGTVKHFVTLRDEKSITNKEAIDLALSVENARSLASFAIFQTEGGIYHWANCEIKHDLATKVTLIKRLEN